MVLAGTYMPRMKGSFKITPSGIEGELANLDDLEPGSFLAYGPATAQQRVAGTGDVRHPLRAVQEIIDTAVEQGWRVRSAKHHFVLIGPEGQLITVPSTPTTAASQNLLNVARNFGLLIPENDSIE